MQILSSDLQQPLTNFERRQQDLSKYVLIVLGNFTLQRRESQF